MPLGMWRTARADARIGGVPVFKGEHIMCHITAANRDEAFVARLRVDPTVDHGVVFWCVTDNLRKGAATNAIQIAEELLRRNLVRRPALKR